MISEEKYIDKINYELNNLINVARTHNEEITATAIVTLKQPIFLIFKDLLMQINRKDADIQRMQELLDKSNATNVELNKDLEKKRQDDKSYGRRNIR